MIQVASFKAVDLALILALTPLWTSAMGAGGVMLVELCGSDAPVLNQNPALPQDPPHPHCPDCLLPLAAAFLPKPVLKHPDFAARAAVYADFPALPVRWTAVLRAFPRGPPTLI